MDVVCAVMGKMALMRIRAIFPITAQTRPAAP